MNTTVGASALFLVCSGLLAGCSNEVASAPMSAPPAPAVTAAIDDVQQRLDQYATVRLNPDLTKLGASEREMLGHLIRAANVMDDIYWQQTYGDRAALMKAVPFPLLQRLIDINYGPWDRLDDFKPLTSTAGVRPPGSNLYPADVTKAELDGMDTTARENDYSVVRRDSAGKLMAIPYNVFFAAQLQAAANELRQAALLANDASLKKYLALRADALLSNEYRDSDLAWMDMKSNRIDAIIGPIENYQDGMLGKRAAFEGIVLVKDMDWSKRLARFARLLPRLQRGLPVPAAYKRESPGSDSELNAYDVLLYAGEANSGAKTIAINLPNDEQVQLEKGTRRLQLKNTMQAKFDQILKPIATELIAEEQQSNIRFDAFFANIMFHEVAHGLGIKNTINGKGTVREALRELAGSFEEAKADILGLHLVTQLLARKELRDTTLADHYVTFVAGILRSVRFSAADAHGKANMIEFNYFLDNGALTRDAQSGRYRVDVKKAQTATELLAARILKMQGDGDYAAAQTAIAAEAQVRPQLQADLAKLTARKVPIDIIFDQGEKVLGL